MAEANIPPNHRDIYDFLLTKAKLRIEECVPYSRVLYDHKAETVDELNRKTAKNSNFLSECNIIDAGDIESIMGALRVEFPQDDEEKQAIILPIVPPLIQVVDDDNVIDMQQWLMDNSCIDAVHALTYARMIICQNNVLTWSKLKNKLISDPGFLYRDCHIRNDYEISIMQGLGVKSRLECVKEKLSALSIELDQKLSEILSRRSSWIECDRELSTLIDLRLQVCLHQVESICGGDEVLMNESKIELDDMISKLRTRLRQGWEMVVTTEFDSASNRLLTQMIPVNAGNVDELGSHLSSFVQAMDGSLRAISSKFGSVDEYVKTKMDLTMDQLIVQYGLIKRGFETLLGLSGQVKQELTDILQEVERNFANMKWDDVEARLTSTASNLMNRLTEMQSDLILPDELSTCLIEPFRLELNGFANEKRSGLKRAWDELRRMRLCKNELDCRRVIVDVLKNTRGAPNWNGPDDGGNRFNWSEELPLGEWDGIAPHWNVRRIQVDGNGMITKLFLNHLGMRGMLPESFGKLTTLTHLFVDNNQLTQLPDKIGSLTSLDYLDVTSNRLTHLPDTIGNLISLSWLEVGNNRLTELPDSIANLASLTRLVVRNNPITSKQADKNEVKWRFGRDGLDICC